MTVTENAPTPGDTIAAVATPPGRAGIGVIRVSGPRAAAIGAALTGAALAERRASFRRFRAAGGEVLDEGIAVLFKAPASFTGEDVLEIHAHGSPVVLGALLDRVFNLGARPAHPGEFSQRAFLNGKYDLAQLEAVADLVNSSSIQAARSAQRVLQGEFSRAIARLSAEIKELRVLTEAALDFPEEDVDVVGDYQLVRRLEALIESIRDIAARAAHGARLTEGAELVIAGRPNAGKSSLLNRLSQTDEAIVSNLAGTTRDIVKSEILLDGIPLRVLDTAGIGAPDDVAKPAGSRAPQPGTAAVGAPDDTARPAGRRAPQLDAAASAPGAPGDTARPADSRAPQLDTAAIGASGDAVEEEGMRRALRAMDAADIVLLLVDATAGIGDAERAVARRLSDNTLLLTIFNKADLTADRNDPNADLWISAKTGEGLDNLRALIKQKIIMADIATTDSTKVGGAGDIATTDGTTIDAGAPDAGAPGSTPGSVKNSGATTGGSIAAGAKTDSTENAIAARRRHLSALSQAQQSLQRALEHLRPAAARTELAAEGLKEAQQSLAAITGAYTTEDLLGDIFAGFCIGK